MSVNGELRGMSRKWPWPTLKHCPGLSEGTDKIPRNEPGNYGIRGNTAR
jgi:hypothetical protein